MRKNIYANTYPGFSPQFISINSLGNGLIDIMVRNPANPDQSCGNTALTVLNRDQAIQMANSIFSYYQEPAPAENSGPVSEPRSQALSWASKAGATSPEDAAAIYKTYKGMKDGPVDDKPVTGMPTRLEIAKALFDGAMKKEQFLMGTEKHAKWKWETHKERYLDMADAVMPLFRADLVQPSSEEFKK